MIGGVGSTGAASAASGMFGSAPSQPTGVRAEFLKRAQMSFAEQMRAKMLDALGLTEDQLKAMSPDEQAKVEAKIKDMIKTQVEQDQEKKKGALVDIKA